ncbi:propionyl-CoA carboxylase-like protein [Protomyces lactucae-debilis]|uniref:Propionyl-CoA carboxylase beta chain, mitochondrial n=1 Tax=Protomyces lactucae-debilis TaxID=2754530 RepID=A0A1Y2F7B7_PROLT|nr:propionyl-CoA carboxylase-like protein [Protomyces lactucae-debilis]ORY79820.1 propionyl-CoA carboxylase-like protein [Protomyces lactucae-debilis]
MSRRWQKKSQEDQFKDIYDKIDQIHGITRNPPLNSRGYDKHIKTGKLWVRTRINTILDKDSYREIGTVTGTPTFKGNSNEMTDFVPTNYLSGFGTINGRRVGLAADDFTIRAGHADGALFQKALYFEHLALVHKVPIIRLIDGSSGGGSVAVYKDMGYTYIPPATGAGWTPMLDSLSQVPVIGCILGPAVGLGAAKVTMTHFSVISNQVGSMFNAGPIVVEKAGIEEGLTNSDLGGPGVVCANGAIDNYGESEKDCFEIIRQFLEYMPSSVLEYPPLRPYSRLASDKAAARAKILDNAIPRQSSRSYQIYPIVEALLDEESWFEVGPAWGAPSITGFGRIAGHTVGLITFNVESPSLGALTAAGAKKLQRHVELCSLFGIPIVQLVDMPGFAIGSQAEREGTMRAGVDCVKAYYNATVPMFNVVIRKCYGIAGAFLVDNKLPHFRVAWPSGEWGSLPLEGGIEAAYAFPLKQAFQKGGPEAAKKLMGELQHDFAVLSDPVRTAMSFGVEEIVRPSQTRGILVDWCKMVYKTLLPQRMDMERIRVGLYKSRSYL